jgi:hypothetical protein
MQAGSNCSWLEDAHELALDSDTDFLPNFKPRQAGDVVRVLKILGQQLNFTEQLLGQIWNLLNAVF